MECIKKQKGIEFRYENGKIILNPDENSKSPLEMSYTDFLENYIVIDKKSNAELQAIALVERVIDILKSNNCSKVICLGKYDWFDEEFSDDDIDLIYRKTVEYGNKMLQERGLDDKYLFMSGIDTSGYEMSLCFDTLEGFYSRNEEYENEIWYEDIMEKCEKILF